MLAISVLSKQMPMLSMILMLAGTLDLVQAQEPLAAPTNPNRVVMVAPFENMTKVKAMVSYEAAAAASAPQGTESTVTVVDQPAVTVVTSKPAPPLRRTITVDRYSEAPRGLMEDILSKQTGITLVERQRVDSLLMEQQFSGLSDSKETVALGKMAGAQYLVTGTIQDVAAREKVFNGYGVAVRNTIVTATVRVRMIEIATGRIVASTTADGAESFTTTGFAGTTDSDVAFKVITNAVNKIKDDAVFLAQVSGRGTAASGDAVAVLIDPKPTGCDILLDGAFVGNSPQTINLQVNKAVRLTLRHTGYQEWDNNVMPREGMKVAPSLADKSDKR